MSQAAAMNNTPAYGAALRDEWGLEPDFLTVNHGSYGATPKAVAATPASTDDKPIVSARRWPRIQA
mgnify:CR=1 FL=1